MYPVADLLALPQGVLAGEGGPLCAGGRGGAGAVCERGLPTAMARPRVVRFSSGACICFCASTCWWLVAGGSLDLGRCKLLGSSSWGPGKGGLAPLLCGWLAGFYPLCWSPLDVTALLLPAPPPAAAALGIESFPGWAATLDAPPGSLASLNDPQCTTRCAPEGNVTTLSLLSPDAASTVLQTEP